MSNEMTTKQLNEEIEHAEQTVIPDLLKDIALLKAEGDEIGERMHVDILREIRQDVREWKAELATRVTTNC